MIEVMTEVVKLAYETGLDRGYDMAAEVFDPEGGEGGEGGSPDDSDDVPEGDEHDSNNES